MTVPMYNIWQSTKQIYYKNSDKHIHDIYKRQTLKYSLNFKKSIKTFNL